MKHAWFAVIVRRSTGLRLFLSCNVARGTGLIYMANSSRWSMDARPFDGEVLHVEWAESFGVARAVFRTYKRRAKQDAKRRATGAEGRP